MKNSLLITSLSLLITSCSVNPDPNKAGLFDSMYHLSKGTYEQRKENKKQKLKALNQEQQNKKKQLHSLNMQLQQKKQKSALTERSLQQLKKLHQLKQQQLQVSKKRFSSNKKQHIQLQKQINSLNNGIKRENAQTKLQAQHILSLQKERNALRKEIITQSSTP